jgi:predicted GH43/DUF377 family glycosyl hydrolase
MNRITSWSQARTSLRRYLDRRLHSLVGAVAITASFGVPFLRAAETQPVSPGSAIAATPMAKPAVLEAEAFQHYFAAFNQNDNELYQQQIPNSVAWDTLKRKIPLLDCPDREIEEIYYFRWWTFRKHIKLTPDGFVITEFLPPVPWAGRYNTISCAASHHLREGRWLKDPRYLDDYSVFWFRKGGNPRTYSFWAADAIWSRFEVTGDDRVAKELLPDLVTNYEAWEHARRDTNGLFWQVDGQDGMEVSISGALSPGAEGYRATINSYMYGDALAIARMAQRTGQGQVADRFRAKAAELKRLVQEQLWDPQAQFFMVLPRGKDTHLSDAREEHGYTPWYFNLPDPDKSAAWKQLMDPLGFYAPFGPTTAERRHPQFAVAYTGHECQWNGPSWPYATAITLTALANLLNHYQQNFVSPQDYFDLLKVYTRSHHLKLDDGRVVPWIDENLNPTNGDWTARTLLRQRGSVIPERGKDYNHSTYCDLVISGLIGLRPRADDTVEVNPLVPGSWDFFCLDQVWYHGRRLTILWDKTGERYHRGVGLRILADGKEIATSQTLRRVSGKLTGEVQSPKSKAQSLQTTAGWVKYDANPVMGGQYGTCFDVSVLKENGAYRMWLSWRPKQSVALVESKDGIHWSEPPQVVLGPRNDTGWEEDINRPVVLKREDGYHLWFTGQAKGHSAIGYATSPDGIAWKRLSDRPVLAPEKPWEKVAVMCPHVLWDVPTKLFRMWYSGGEQNEPNAIGYATSPDGLNWTKHPDNPIFAPDLNLSWEKHKATACQVERLGDWHVMFYIGFRDEPHAQIGLARSRDGITNWQRHPANPIIRPGENQWDHDACYKPYAIFDGQKWLLWYNGRHGGLEQIGVVFHPGEDLGF